MEGTDERLKPYRAHCFNTLKRFGMAEDVFPQQWTSNERKKQIWQHRNEIRHGIYTLQGTYKAMKIFTFSDAAEGFAVYDFTEYIVQHPPK